MIRKVDSSGDAISRGGPRPLLDELSKNTNRIGQTVTSTVKNTTAYTLKGHTVESSFGGVDYLQTLKQRHKST